MRGKTVKRLKAYTRFLKEQDKMMPLENRKFEQFNNKQMNRKLKRLWHKDKVFQEFIRNVIVTNQFI